MKKSKFIKFTSAILLISHFIFISCKKETTENYGKPSLPPQSTFIIDTSTLPQQNTKSINNWGHSIANVAIWNTIIFVGMAVPVASFQEAAKHECVSVETNKWKWAYDVTAPDKATYTCELYATVSETDINWEMQISKQDGFQKFTWYTGISKVNGSQGTWILYENPFSKKQMLSIEWHRNTDNTADIKYTNIIPGGIENGGYIHYGISNNPLNAYYTIFNKGKNNKTEIEWDTKNKNGHVKDVLKFGDNNWHCWDTTLQDTDCN